MRKAFRTTVIAGVALALFMGSLLTMAQDQGGRRGNFDPEQMRSMMMERMKTQLEASDDEWKVIEPLVQAVMEKQMATRQGMRGFGRFGGPGGQGGPGGPNAPQAQGQGQRGDRPDRGGQRGFQPPSDPEADALQTVLENKDASSDDIKAKLTAYRTARQQREADLKKSREDLRKVLTLRQEAQMVLMGYLD